jgi:hypothetical protein
MSRRAPPGQHQASRHGAGTANISGGAPTRAQRDGMTPIPRFICTDNQHDLLPRVRAERARRAAYAACDRAPLGWEHHHA